jgi:hypothetical protein
LTVPDEFAGFVTVMAWQATVKVTVAIESPAGFERVYLKVSAPVKPEAGV